MKIIFSRKGFDSAAGGLASPILDGQPRSLPIPSDMPSLQHYHELRAPLPQVLSDLSKGRFDLQQRCHLDPDIDIDAGPVRGEGWRGALGQVGSSQSHLRNLGVGAGDIFLFWGLFAHVSLTNGRWKYTGRAHHLIFGWMEVEHVYLFDTDNTPLLTRFPWLRDHPHAQPGWDTAKHAIYVAPAKSMRWPDHPGFGTLPKGYQLTADSNDKKSIWTVPDWLHIAKGGTGFTYHPEHRWLDGNRLQAAGRGQEFVADVGDRSDANAWVYELTANR